MGDVVQIEDQFYVRATSGLTDDRTRVLKFGSMLGVFDRFGEIESFGSRRFGLFYEETRHLSRFSLTINNDRPLLLSSIVHADNLFLSVDLTNLDRVSDGTVALEKGTVHIFRQLFLAGSSLFQSMRILNHGMVATDISVHFDFDADFADIFEVRGAARDRCGTILPSRRDHDDIVLSYRGLDSVLRSTRINFSPPPTVLDPRQAQYELRLKSKEEVAIVSRVTCERSDRSPRTIFLEEAQKDLFHTAKTGAFGDVQVATSNRQFNAWLDRSRADLQMLMTGNSEGDYPYAGVPWFNTVFGRDGIITALQCLWIAPSIAASVLRFLASTQAQKTIPEQDAEPGKIVHEMRRGEMAVIGQVPFARYYGSVDSTPLFVVLAGAYFKRTGDVAMIEHLWPAIEAALHWIDSFGDADGDGFVEYSRQSPEGLVQQGWKDSHDSIFHANGESAPAPIALCEVQGYVYAAKRAAASMAKTLSRGAHADRLEQEAEILRDRFQGAFWCEDLASYGLALDGEKKLCRVKTSNAGHALFCGIASPDHAGVLSSSLFADHIFSGWGIRTVGATEVRYNPISYHNGSVWPHDNSIIGKGLAKYGYTEQAARLLDSLSEASLHMDSYRMPELFCGFHRRGQNGGPTLYPVACSPQAWSAGSVYLLLEACLGLEIMANEREIHFLRPCLPSNLDWVNVKNLVVSETAFDLELTRQDGSLAIKVNQRGRPLTVVNRNKVDSDCQPQI